MTPRDLLIASFHTALNAVRAEAILPAHLPPLPKGRTLVVGAGKAAADMAACLERHWPESAPLSGLVITRHGHGAPCRRIKVVEAGHPLPDSTGLDAAQTLLHSLSQAQADDLIIALISGGGSSLLSLPVPGISLADLAKVSRALLQSGAEIDEINVVRKHLSLTLGGRLAQRSRCPVQVLLVSDVVGNDPATIASGPFAADPSSYHDALDILSRWRIATPSTIHNHLAAGARGMFADTPKPGHPCFQHVEHVLLADGRTALQAAGKVFRLHGYQTVVLGDAIKGEAREVAKVFAGLAAEIHHHASPWQRPVVLLSGGETTVSVQGTGHGGRNSEFALALALELKGQAKTHALAADTDGIDGAMDFAGAVIDPTTLHRAASLGLEPRRHLDANDTHTFFNALGDSLETGPTRINVNDYRAVLLA